MATTFAAPGNVSFNERTFEHRSSVYKTLRATYTKKQSAPWLYMRFYALAFGCYNHSAHDPVLTEYAAQEWAKFVTTTLPRLPAQFMVQPHELAVKHVQWGCVAAALKRCVGPALDCNLSDEAEALLLSHLPDEATLDAMEYWQTSETVWVPRVAEVQHSLLDTCGYALDTQASTMLYGMPYHKTKFSHEAQRIPNEVGTPDTHLRLLAFGRVLMTMGANPDANNSDDPNVRAALAHAVGEWQPFVTKTVSDLHAYGFYEFDDIVAQDIDNGTFASTASTASTASAAASAAAPAALAKWRRVMARWEQIMRCEPVILGGIHSGHPEWPRAELVARIAGMLAAHLPRTRYGFEAATQVHALASALTTYVSDVQTVNAEYYHHTGASCWAKDRLGQRLVSYHCATDRVYGDGGCYAGGLYDAATPGNLAAARCARLAQMQAKLRAEIDSITTEIQHVKARASAVFDV